mmetsp:Transcript_24648/g.62400  ORF Transcript_24648/g.62400 Transcript_24648/m.62400 type:complete len:80 (+) Transcript_24648:564-803(+)
MPPVLLFGLQIVFHLLLDRCTLVRIPGIFLLKNHTDNRVDALTMECECHQSGRQMSSFRPPARTQVTIHNTHPRNEANN